MAKKTIDPVDIDKLLSNINSSRESLVLQADKLRHRLSVPYLVRQSVHQTIQKHPAKTFLGTTLLSFVLYRALRRKPVREKHFFSRSPKRSWPITLALFSFGLIKPAVLHVAKKQIKRSLSTYSEYSDPQ